MKIIAQSYAKEYSAFAKAPNIFYPSFVRSTLEKAGFAPNSA
jgi:hypothetical protein